MGTKSSPSLGDCFPCTPSHPSSQFFQPCHCRLYPKAGNSLHLLQLLLLHYLSPVILCLALKNFACIIHPAYWVDISAFWSSSICTKFPLTPNSNFWTLHKLFSILFLAIILDWVPPSWVEILFPAGNSLILLIFRKWLKDSLSSAVLAARLARRLLVSVTKLQQDTKPTQNDTRTQTQNSGHGKMSVFRRKDVQFSCLDSNYFCLSCCILCTYLHVVHSLKHLPDIISISSCIIMFHQTQFL